MSGRPRTVLFVANFPPNTGYAWDFIEGLYARIGDHLAASGVRSLVAYPSLASLPRPLEGSRVEPIALPLDLASRRSVERFAEAAARESVELLYLTDRPSRSLAFRRIRAAGVGYIIVHDHTSGHRTPPRGLRRIAKRLLNAVPGALADSIITVSDYVARRQREVALVPPDRIVRVYNGVPLPPGDDTAPRTHAAFGVDPDRPIVACACRAHPVKGVDHLFRAFDRVTAAGLAGPPALVYAGDGPQRGELEALRARLGRGDDIVMPGFVPDADRLLEGAAFFVVPSVWQDALPLSVMEPMARGKAVIASRVGGIPEMIEDGVSGLLVEPGDEDALARAMSGLLREPGRAERLGAAARERVATRFRPETQRARLIEIVERGLDACARTPPGAGGPTPPA